MPKTIAIVTYVREWILDDISKAIYYALSQSGYSVFFHSPNDNHPPSYDYFFHIHYLHAAYYKSSVNIYFVTHVASPNAVDKLLHLAQLSNVFFVTMSRQTAHAIAPLVGNSRVLSLSPSAYWRGPNLSSNQTSRRNSLTPTYLIASNYYSDTRKRPSDLVLAIRIFNALGWRGVIYGQDWPDSITKGPYNLLVDPTTFKYDTYISYMTAATCLLYLGWDEGSMSVLDAVQLDLPVIATSQGFHLDLPLPLGSLLVNDRQSLVYSIKSFALNSTHSLYSSLSELLRAIDCRADAIPSSSIRPRRLHPFDRFLLHVSFIPHVLRVYQLCYTCRIYLGYSLRKLRSAVKLFFD